MKRFAELYTRLDSTTKTNQKVATMADYFSDAAPEDAAWATYFLSGNRLRRLVATKLLRQWAAEEAGIPTWLLEESYHAVGDLAETISLIVPPGNDFGSDDSGGEDSLTHWIETRLKPLGKLPEDPLRQAIVGIWNETVNPQRFVTMKLITGAFRVGVSRRLVTRAIAESAGIAADVVAHRLMGNWEPTAGFYRSLINPDDQDARLSQPYPFCLAHPMDLKPATNSKLPTSESAVAGLGDPADFVAEWKWDGIRGQLIRRSGETFLWSRGEELMENRWPEIESAAQSLPDGSVIDGEILACQADGTVLPFAQLQRRINRKTVGKKLLSEVPVVFHAFDLVEQDGQDIRTLSFDDRRRRLEQVLDTVRHPHLRVTELIAGQTWRDWETIREQSRSRNAEGLMLKRRSAPYDVGRVRGTWWKWKVEPYTVDAVLIYAQKGHGKRSGLFTDYTFAVWDGDTLVPLAKAYSGLTDAEIQKVDRFVRQNTRDSFGPVRSVAPELVMELAFEGLQRSTRHKSGIATRFPRIVRWRHDKKPADANTLDDVQSLL